MKNMDTGLSIGDADRWCKSPNTINLTESWLWELSRASADPEGTQAGFRYKISGKPGRKLTRADRPFVALFSLV